LAVVAPVPLWRTLAVLVPLVLTLLVAAEHLMLPPILELTILTTAFIGIELIEGALEPDHRSP
jgi:hypothetical protein